MHLENILNKLSVMMAQLCFECIDLEITFIMLYVVHLLNQLASSLMLVIFVYNAMFFYEW